MLTRRKEAYSIIAITLLLVLGITWMEITRYQDGLHESYRGERSGFSTRISLK